MVQLLRSRDAARSIAPDAWSVTLFPDAFRLNVGVVETLVVGSGWIRLNCMGEDGTPPFASESFQPAIYNSVPGPKFAYVGSLREFFEVASTLAEPHRQFIQRAGTTKSGRPVAGSTNRRSHSQPLIDYAEAFVAGSVEGREEERDTPRHFREGQRFSAHVTRFERDPEARRVCLDHYGSVCVVCGFRSEQVFGEQIASIIHVHHLTPLSLAAIEQEVNPVKDLRPVCPNCHAAIHSRNPPYEIEEIIALRKAAPLVS